MSGRIEGALDGCEWNVRGVPLTGKVRGEWCRHRGNVYAPKRRVMQVTSMRASVPCPIYRSNSNPSAPELNELMFDRIGRTS